jgi:hypothetical protein
VVLVSGLDIVGRVRNIVLRRTLFVLLVCLVHLRIISMLLDGILLRDDLLQDHFDIGVAFMA